LKINIEFITEKEPIQFVNNLYNKVELKKMNMPESKKRNAGNGIGLGVALGVVFGVVYGSKYGNLSQSMAIGLAMGAAIGAIFDFAGKEK